MKCPDCSHDKLADSKVKGYLYCPRCGRGSIPKAKDSTGEMVDHPTHYGGADNPYEHIKVAEAWGLGYHIGNATKYLSRAGKKGAAKEDLKKALWYITRAHEQHVTSPSGGLFLMSPTNVAEAWGLSSTLARVLEAAVTGSYGVAKRLLREVIDEG